VARSAELVLALGAVLLVAGCSTTQQKSARAKVQAERLLATRKQVLVRQPNPSVRVEGVTLLRGHGRTAVVVALRNDGSRPVSDLPISLRTGGGRYLNRRAGLGYFQTHAPAIVPGGEATWVFVTRARVRARGVSARVGLQPAVSARPARLPLLRAAPAAGIGRATVTNSSGVPQYGLVVYAFARRGARLVAAGRGSLARLGPGRRATVPLSLVGSARGLTMRVQAPPTIFK
jgi:hypothetical protein